MNSLSVQAHAGNHLSPSQQPFTPPPSSALLSLNNMVSPAILLIIIILAIVFFISGLLHLLVRFLPRPLYRDPNEFDDATALQGPLQQLFHLHDSGVDQTFIDTLPIFSYKSIIGVKNSPFDCAVCLCEFDSEDRLRLLPKCSHAFHMDCIDTWLLSHSTCPLCRSCLLSDFGTYGYNNCSPVVLVLESGSESSREIVSEREGGLDGAIVNSHLGVEEFGAGAAHGDVSRKSCEIQVKEEGNHEKKEEKIVIVKLGKFKNVDGRYREESSGGVNGTNVDDGRRCFSMGSYEYVMDEDASLKVPIKTPIKKLSGKKPALPLIPGKKLAMSECDCESRRYFEELDGFRSFSRNAATSTKISSNGNNVIGKSKRESFSLSRIWTRGKKKDPNSSRDESSSRASSFRFPMQRNVVAADETKAKNHGNDSGRTASEIGIGRWENAGSELGCDEENQSCNSLDSQANSQSFTTRTLLWLMGKQNKVVHSSYPPGV